MKKQTCESRSATSLRNCAPIHMVHVTHDPTWQIQRGMDNTIDRTQSTASRNYTARLASFNPLSKLHSPVSLECKRRDRSATVVCCNDCLGCAMCPVAAAASSIHMRQELETTSRILQTQQVPADYGCPPLQVAAEAVPCLFRGAASYVISCDCNALLEIGS